MLQRPPESSLVCPCVPSPLQGLVPRQYWDSVMGVYQVLVRTSVESGAVPASPASAPSAQTKVRQKMLEDLGAPKP